MLGVADNSVELTTRPPRVYIVRGVKPKLIKSSEQHMALNRLSVMSLILLTF